MNKIEWKILDITADGELITSAKYHCQIIGSETVETEGFWYFESPTLATPFDQVTENMVVEWIKAETIRDGKNLITSRLQEQLTEIENKKPVVAPWLPQVFTPEI